MQFDPVISYEKSPSHFGSSHFGSISAKMPWSPRLESPTAAKFVKLALSENTKKQVEEIIKNN
jgi:hypothetical protein